MPCYSEQRDFGPNARERESKIVAEHLVFVCEKLGTTACKAAQKAAVDSYGNQFILDELTESLCSTIKSMDRAQLKKIVFNGYDKRSRRLADWWERHQEFDRKRERKEREAKEREDMIKSARSKLTKKEIEALGI